MSEQTQDEVEVKTPAGSIRARGTDLIAVLVLIGLALMAYVLVEHKIDARAAAAEFVDAVRQMTVAQKESTAQQRLMNCIISLPQEKREREFFSPDSFCKRVTVQ